MNDIQENKLSMYYSVKEVNEKNITIVESVEALKKANSDFKAKITEINTIKEAQSMVSTGVTEDKAFAMVEMANAAVVVIGAGSAYSLAKNDKALLENINYSRSNILYGRDQDAYTKCMKVYDELNPLMAELTQYGLTPAIMTAFLEKINAYNAIVQSPRGAISEKKSATMQLPDLFTATDNILKIMDGMVKGFKTSEVDYYNTYFAAREIIDLGIRHKKPVVPPTP